MSNYGPPGSNYGPPGDGGYYDDGTGGYRGQRPPQEPRPEQPVPWYRTPGAMFAAGALSMLVLALIVWSVFGSDADDADTTSNPSLTPITQSATTTPRSAAPTTETTTVTETSTVSATPTTTTETTTSQEPSTTTSTVTSTVTSTSVSTTVSTTTVTAPPPPPGG